MVDIDREAAAFLDYLARVRGRVAPWTAWAMWCMSRGLGGAVVARRLEADRLEAERREEAA